MQTKPANLTKHGIKQISESTNVQSDFANKPVVLQVFDAQIFDEHEKKKNIKARINLSDGFSKMIVMLPDKVFAQIVSATFELYLEGLKRRQSGAVLHLELEH